MGSTVKMVIKWTLRLALDLSIPPLSRKFLDDAEATVVCFIDFEYVKLKDVERLVDLMIAMIKEFPNGPAHYSDIKRNKFISRVNSMEPFIENTTTLFSKAK